MLYIIDTLGEDNKLYSEELVCSISLKDLKKSFKNGKILEKFENYPKREVLRIS